MREALDKVIKEANINEPFYMRHIYANKNSPDQVLPTIQVFVLITRMKSVNQLSIFCG